ncbi:MAG: hypothetical protein ACRBDI_05220 [Alphaproteobacteria bacterium]
MNNFVFDIATISAALATMVSVAVTLRQKMIEEKAAVAVNAAGTSRR